MEQLIKISDYPANILSELFGISGEDCACYCNMDLLEQTINQIMQFNFTEEDCTVFFSLYKERKSISDIASELQCSLETINYIQSRILRKLRRPKLSRQLKAFTDTVKVCENDSRLISETKLDNEPIAVTDNGEVVAFMISPKLYNTLNQKALLVDKIVYITKQQYDKLYGSL